MAPRDLFETDADAEDTEAALMAATYEALCEYGYADLTIQRIGEEFEKSPSLLYHHYDGKDDLLVAFLGYLLERFEDDVPLGMDAEDPWDRVEGLLEHVLAPTQERRETEFTRAIVELRAQAAHDPDYRAAFARHDEFFRTKLSAIVREGIDEGRFRDVDPDGVAAMVQTTVLGAMFTRVTTDPDDVAESMPAVRDQLRAALRTRLLGEEPR